MKRTIGIAGDGPRRVHRVLAARQRDRVVRGAAGPSGERDDVVRQDLRLLGHVEAERDRPRHGRDRRAPGREHDLRRLGVAVDVPLGRRRGVAGDAIGAAHHDPAPEQARELRLALERDGRGS